MKEIIKWKIWAFLWTNKRLDEDIIEDENSYKYYVRIFSNLYVEMI